MATEKKYRVYYKDEQRINPTTGEVMMYSREPRIISHLAIDSHIAGFQQNGQDLIDEVIEVDANYNDKYPRKSKASNNNLGSLVEKINNDKVKTLQGQIADLQKQLLVANNKQEKSDVELLTSYSEQQEVKKAGRPKRNLQTT